VQDLIPLREEEPPSRIHESPKMKALPKDSE